MNNSWVHRNTFHYSQFMEIETLVARKRERGLSISLCLPTLNEENTIAKEIILLRSELMNRHPLLDEIVVVDSGSKDRTREIARSYGADVHLASDIFPDLTPHRGKGENLWKALHITSGDIIVYLDADIKNIHHRFAYGLLGPLLLNEDIKFSKAYYDRPITTAKNEYRPTGGGRVTELVIRPLFALFFPELTQIFQPLSGEYAGYRELFQQIPFPIGYGIETSMILDICERWGMDVMAQVDLEKRVHRNQDTRALGRMAFVIIKTFLKRIEKMGIVDLNQNLFQQMIQYSLVKNEIKANLYSLEAIERPPIVEIPEYRTKFKLT